MRMLNSSTHYFNYARAHFRPCALEDVHTYEPPALCLGTSVLRQKATKLLLLVHPMVTNKESYYQIHIYIRSTYILLLSEKCILQW